ncbi:MAG: tail fiber protein [Myxococcales bacterium]|nr:tail fiber protein [Myxococcales bacterium]
MWGFFSAISLTTALLAGGYLFKDNNAQADGIPAPNTLNYAGTLQENGTPVNGNVSVIVTLYDAATGGTSLCTTSANTSARDGNFRISLHDSCVDAVRQSPNAYVEVTYKGQVIPGRNKLAAVPYAVVADTLLNKTLTNQLKLLAPLFSFNANTQELTINARAKDNSGFITPVGGVLGFVGTSSQIPAGWFLCDGRAVSRTTYKDLFALLGTTHGAGDGSTTFNIPDYRGRFLRGVDNQTGRDPQSGTRTASFSGGAVGDQPGTLQDWSTARPRVPFQTNTTGNHSHYTSFQNDDFDGCCTGTRGLEDDGSGARNQNLPTNATGDHSHTVSSGGDTETRPANIYINFMIKF